jgi:hypothetical protein
MACISIISISISILKTRFLATFIYSFMTNKLMVRNLMFAKLQLVFNLFIMIFIRYNCFSTDQTAVPAAAAA